MLVSGELFTNVLNVRFVAENDREYLAFSEEHAQQVRNHFTRAARDPHQIVSNATERAIRSILSRATNSDHPRILRADVTYPGKRTTKPFYLEIDVAFPLSTGLAVCEIKTGRIKLQTVARKQLERFAKIAGTDLGPLHLISVLALPIRHQIGPEAVSWPRVSLAEILKGEIGARSTLLVDIEDLKAQFSPDELLALSEYRQIEQTRYLADGFEAKGDLEKAQSLRASLSTAPREIGKLVVDDHGVRVEGGEPAGWLTRKVHLRND
jgi:hypothetical protein